MKKNSIMLLIIILMVVLRSILSSTFKSAHYKVLQYVIFGLAFCQQIFLKAVISIVVFM